MTDKEKLKIYEKRFCIIKGVIHSLLSDKFPVSIGWLEHSYHVHKRNKKCECNKRRI